MKNKTVKYTNNPELGDLIIVKDSLPSPKELIAKEDTVKVTIALTKRSLEFFKLTAKEFNLQYQKMIRVILDEYASKHNSLK